MSDQTVDVEFATPRAANYVSLVLDGGEVKVDVADLSDEAAAVVAAACSVEFLKNRERRLQARKADT